MTFTNYGSNENEEGGFLNGESEPQQKERTEVAEMPARSSGLPFRDERCQHCLFFGLTMAPLPFLSL